EMGMDIDPARHDHHAFGIEGRDPGRKLPDDAPAVDADVTHLAVHSVSRIVDRATGDSQAFGAAHVPLALRARTAARRVDKAPVADRGAESGGRNGSGTSSIR